MTEWKEVSRSRMFGGWQVRYEHQSKVLGCKMAVSVSLPPAAEEWEMKKRGRRPPVVYYLSGLTCNDQNFVTKAGAQRTAARLGIALVAMDTSPRDVGVPEAEVDWDFGYGAGFYLDASQPPFAAHFRMESYLMRELPALLALAFPGVLDLSRASICGHSMGGHGALTLALRHPGAFRSASAFAPICHPSACPWGVKAFTGYLGADNRAAWEAHDATLLVAGYKGPDLHLLVDQGADDKFLRDGQLLPDAFRAACDAAGMALQYREHAGYDHSYFFVASFIDDHLEHHGKFLLQ